MGDLYKVMGLIDNTLVTVQVGFTYEDVMEVSSPVDDIPEEYAEEAWAKYDAFHLQLIKTGHAVMVDRYKVFPTDVKETESVLVAFKM